MSGLGRLEPTQLEFEKVDAQSISLSRPLPAPLRTLFALLGLQTTTEGWIAAVPRTRAQDESDREQGTSERWDGVDGGWRMGIGDGHWLVARL